MLGGLIALGLLLVLELSLRLQGGLEEFANPPSPVGYPGIPGYGELVEPGWRACGGSSHRLCLEPPAGIRVDVYGGSALFGLPYSTFTSLTVWLQRYMAHLVGNKPIEVINHGMVGAQSANLLQGLNKDLAVAKPDLIIVFAGNNEFYALGKRKKVLPLYSPRLELLRHRLWNSRLYRLAAILRVPDEQNLPVLRFGINPSDFVAPITSQDRKLVTLLYQENLTAMTRLAKEKGIPIMLATVPDNLRHRPGSEKQEKEYQDIANKLKEAESGDSGSGVSLAESMLKESDTHARSYAAAEVMLRAGRKERALELFQRAELLDPTPFRSNQELRKAVLEVGGSEQIATCDMALELNRVAQDGIPGFDLFADWCHPNPEGHKQLAKILLRCIRSSGVLALRSSPSSAQVFARSDTTTGEAYRVDRQHVNLNEGPEDKKESSQQGSPDDAGLLPAQVLSAKAFRSFARSERTTLPTRSRIPSVSLPLLRQAIALGGPEGPLQLSIGLIALNEGKPKLARQSLARAAALLPDDPEVINYAKISGAVIR